MKKMILYGLCLLAFATTTFASVERPLPKMLLPLDDHYIWGPGEFTSTDPNETFEIFWIQESSYDNYYEWTIEKQSGDDISTTRHWGQPEHLGTEVWDFINNTGHAATATFLITLNFRDYTNSPVTTYKTVIVHFPGAALARNH